VHNVLLHNEYSIGVHCNYFNNANVLIFNLFAFSYEHMGTYIIPGHKNSPFHRKLSKYVALLTSIACTFLHGSRF